MLESLELPHNERVARCAYCQRPLPGAHDAACPIAQPPPLLASIGSFEQHLRDRTITEPEKEQFIADVERFLAAHGATMVPPEMYETTLRSEAQRNPDLLVRREDPRLLLAVLQHRRPLAIRFLPDAHGGDAYPNAAVLGSGLEGLTIPLGRGFAKVASGAIQFIVGFDASNTVTARPVPADAYAHYRGSTRLHVRMAEGDVPLEHLRFAILRVPRHAFPAAQLSEDEEDAEHRPHIFRLFHFAPSNARAS